MTDQISNEDAELVPGHRRHAARVLRPVQDFLATEVSGALLILGAALVALVWANLAPHSYVGIWEHHINLGGGEAGLHLTLREWVNDVAMTLFFFVVGLELRREITVGELRDRRAIALPVLAAVGGMVVPAVIYLAINAADGAPRGWGIPMATDIAFALAVLTVAGRGLPAKLRVFLLTLAIADDVGAILVIAVFYSAGVSVAWLVAAALGVAALVLLGKAKGRSTLLVALLGVAVWYATFRSGIHPTIAGVVLGLCIPIAAMSRKGPSPARTPLARLEHTLHPWSSFVVVPLFALANAGIVLRLSTLQEAVGSPVFLGVLAGLVVGKVVGVAGATWLASRLGLGSPPGTWGSVLGLSAVAGIGFTVSLFVTELAFPGPPLADAAKLGVLVASVLAGTLGAGLLRRARARVEAPGG